MSTTLIKELNEHSDVVALYAETYCQYHCRSRIQAELTDEENSNGTTTTPSAVSNHHASENNLRDSTFNIQYAGRSRVSILVHEWMVKLMELNMKKMYDETEGWGWNESKKRKEFLEKEARFLFVSVAEHPLTNSSENELDTKPPHSNSRPISKKLRTSNSRSTMMNRNLRPPPITQKKNEPFVAFAHIRFEIDPDDNVPILYIMEIQIEAAYRQFGIGSHIMRMIELIAFGAGLHKCMLTVFRSNIIARNFYKKHGYNIDPSDPSTEEGEENYIVLSKSNPNLKINP